VALLLVTTSAACTDPGYEVVVLFDPPALADDAVAISISVIDECSVQPLGQVPAEPVVREILLRRGDELSALGPLSPGQYGLYALARANDCRVVAAGCEPVDLENGGSGRLTVSADGADGPACGDGFLCDGAGQCRPGGGPDMDAAMMDGGVDGDATVDSGADAAMDAMDASDALDARMDASDGLDGSSLDCSALEAVAEWDFCRATASTCEVVFNDSAGCTDVCAAAGLACLAAHEDADGACEADFGRPELSCDPPSGHVSDYCICGVE
jgi:hypothetical protein